MPDKKARSGVTSLATVRQGVGNAAVLSRVLVDVNDRLEIFSLENVGDLDRREGMRKQLQLLQTLITTILQRGASDAARE